VSNTPQGEQLFAAKPYVILKVNGLRVAIIGAMTDSLDSLTTPPLLQQWHTIPVVETVRRYARELKPQSDLIVLLGHITGPEELKILAEVPEIPVLVTGHLHNGLPQPLTQDGRVLVRVRGYAEPRDIERHFTGGEVDRRDESVTRIHEPDGNARSGDQAFDVGRAPTAVAVAEVGLFPIGARHDVAARRRSARALELVVVVGVGHRVVEAELLAGGDISHGDEQHGSHDPAIRLAGVVDVVGVVERQGAGEEEVVVDLERVDLDLVVEVVQLGPGDHMAAEPGNGRAGRDRLDREDPPAFGARGVSGGEGAEP